MSLSRRDGIYQQLGSIRQAIADAQTQPMTDGHHGRPSGGASSAMPSSVQGITDYMNRLQVGLNNAVASTSLGGASMSGGPPRSIADVPGYTSAPLTRTNSNATARSGDALPTYSRSQDVAVTKYSHSISTSNGKVEIVLDSVGSKQHPIYVSDLCSTVSGKVKLRLQGQENITEVRIRVKGIITLALPSATQSGSRSLGEEIEFFFAGSPLWSASDQTSVLDPALELHEFPFSIPIPEQTPSSVRIPKQYPMPPSFMLEAAQTFGLGGIEHASIKYYVKVTVARKGLLRPNDRLFAPFLYLPRQRDVTFLSEARQLALTNDIPLPSPLEDEEAWAGKKEEKVVRKGLFGNKQSTYTIAFFLPVPHIYGKVEKIPYYLRVNCEDSSVVNKLGPTSVSVNLVQKAIVQAGTAAGSKQTIISRAESELNTSALLDPSEQGRRFKGVIDLSKVQVASFRAPALSVHYQVTCTVAMSGQGSNESQVTIPITIVSIPSPARQVASSQSEQPSQSIPADVRPVPAIPSIATSTSQASPPPPPAGAQSPLAGEVPDLPPSYFDVVEQAPRLGGGKR